MLESVKKIRDHLETSGVPVPGKVSVKRIIKKFQCTLHRLQFCSFQDDSGTFKSSQLLR